MITLRAPDGITLAISERGATWMTCEIPLAGLGRRDVILRRSTDDHQSFLGSTIGRYANRIAQGRIRYEGREYQLALRAGSPHHLHGGPEGFHAREWQVRDASATHAHFVLHSPDGDQGYPGALTAQVVYRLADAMTIEMEMRATTTAPTPVALTNHAYFNLDGTGSDVRQHALRIRASKFMPVDRELIPLGLPRSVEGTSFDFRASKPIARSWLADEQQHQARGYDHAFLLEPECASMLGAPAAELVSARGDLALAIRTSLPALQFYAGQYLAGTMAPGGATYPACAAVALEPGFLPDSPNHPEWPQPNCWLHPGETFAHTIRYSFRQIG